MGQGKPEDSEAP